MEDTNTHIESETATETSANTTEIETTNESVASGDVLTFERSADIPEQYRAFQNEGGLEFFSNLVSKFNIEKETAQQILNEVDKYTHETTKKFEEIQSQTMEQQRENVLSELESELGGKSKVNKTIENINSLLATVGVTDEEIQEAGIGNNKGLIKILAKVQSMVGEDKAVGITKKVNTEADLMSRIEKLKGGFNSAYYDHRHPDHNLVVKQVKELMEQN